jgi:hypothetical protein
VEYEEVVGFSDGLAWVLKDGKWDIIEANPIGTEEKIDIDAAL